MLTEEDIRSLPDDPAQAFAAMADKLAKLVSESAEFREGLSQADAMQAAEDIYAHLAATDTEDLFPRLAARPPRNTEGFWDWWAEFISSVRYYRTYILMSQKAGPLTVVLNESHRAKIRALLVRVREIVPKLKVSEAKRENIINLVTKLESEVERPRTWTESFFGMLLIGGATAKQLGDDAKPLIDDLERIKNIFSDAKADDLPLPQLPPPTVPKKIENRSGVPRSKSELDDDIPF